MILKTTILLDGLVFPECPRWHDSKLWFSDIYAHHVMNVNLAGHSETVVTLPGYPSGLGWLPNDQLVVVSLLERELLRLDPEGLVLVADVSKIDPFGCNDMVISKQGWAYIGTLGFDFLANQPFAKANLVLVTLDGTVRVVADQLDFPNGMVITPDGHTIIVAESTGERLTAFDLASDGSLTNRRIWAQIEGHIPDGICLDAESAIWVASPGSGEVLRVHEGGEITHRIQTTNPPFACMLGGIDRRTLFVLSAAANMPEEARALQSGRIETVRVEVPGAGLP